MRDDRNKLVASFLCLEGFPDHVVQDAAVPEVGQLQLGVKPVKNGRIIEDARETTVTNESTWRGP